MDQVLERPADIVGPVTDRSWADTKRILLIPDRDWTNKKILDIGSGKKADSPDLVFKGATVTSLDPSFFVGQLVTPDDYRKTREDIYKEYMSLEDIVKRNLVIGPQENTAHHQIKARVQALPYADKSFDLLTSMLSIPMYLEEEDKPNAIQEMVRVTKRGGEIRLWPVTVTPEEAKLPWGMAAYLREIRSGGYGISGFGPDKKGLLITIPQ